MRGNKLLVLLLVTFPLCLMVKANHCKDGKTEPVLMGSVTDATTKKPVAGVVISITSARINGEKEYTTDAGGTFRVSQFPAGEVTIVLEKKGYKTCRREGVVLKEGINLRISFDIKMEEVESPGAFHPFLRMIEGRR